MRISDWSSDVCSSDLGTNGSTQVPLDVTNSGTITMDLSTATFDGGAAIWATDLGGNGGGNSSGSSVTNSGAITMSRSDKRRGGKECVRTCKTRWSPLH